LAFAVFYFFYFFLNVLLIFTEALEAPSEWKELALRLTALEPSQRPSASTALEFFSSEVGL